MGKRETQPIQAGLGMLTYIPALSDIFRHIQEYSEIIQAFSEPYVILA